MRAEKWQFISRKEIVSHPRMHLVEDIVKLPNGQETEYLRLAPQSAHSVAIIAINDKQEMLLQREYSYPPDAVLWQLPGGGMMEGEAIEAAANRELAEESNYNGRSFQELGWVFINNRRSDR